MYKTLDMFLQRISLFFHNVFGVTPNGLSYARIFATPWIVLLIVETLSTKSVALGIATVVIYALVVFTDALDGSLARALRAKRQGISHDAEKGGALDRISDKILIVFGLIPFGINTYAVIIIFGESLLAYEALLFGSTKSKQATYIGKIKMFLQTFLIPLILFEVLFANKMLSTAVFVLFPAAALFTALSVWFHYK